LRCLEASIACIGNGKIVHLLGKVCRKGIIDIEVWHLKLWKIMTSRFGTLFFAWRHVTMTSTCYSARWCLREFLKAMLMSPKYDINGHQCTKWYYLVVVIYPRWSTFVKTIFEPQGQKNLLCFTPGELQERCRASIWHAPVSFWYCLVPSLS
jgi:hypothetical protein